jgi:hypothetical protein
MVGSSSSPSSPSSSVHGSPAPSNSDARAITGAALITRIAADLDMPN